MAFPNSAQKPNEWSERVLEPATERKNGRALAAPSIREAEEALAAEGKVKAPRLTPWINRF